MNFSRFVSYSILITASISGAACTFNPAEKILNNIENNKFDKANNLLTKHLKSAPDDQTLNSLASWNILKECFTTSCLSTNPSLLNNLDAHLQYVPELLVSLNKTDTFSLWQQLEKVDYTAYTPQHIAILKTHLQGTPIEPFIATTFWQTIRDDFNFSAPENTITTLQELIEAETANSPHQLYYSFLIELLKGDGGRANAFIIALRSRQDDLAKLPAPAFDLLTYALFVTSVKENPENGTDVFLNSLPQTLKNMKLPRLLNDTAKENISSAIATLATRSDFIQTALQHYPENDKPTETELAVMLYKLAVQIAPQHTALWQKYIAAAKPLVLQQNAWYLISDISPGALPTDIQPQFREMLVTLLEAPNVDTAAISAMLEQLNDGNPLNNQIQHKLERKIKDDLEAALAAGDIRTVVELAQLQPEVAQQQRQTIVPLVIESIRQQIKDNNFADVEGGAAFLNDVMDIDFNLDAIVQQEIDAALKADNISQALAATNTTYLELPAEEAAYDLGPKFTFFADYFKNAPAIADNILKRLVTNAAGQYGTANALWRLQNYFTEVSLTSTERQAYFMRTLENQLMHDEQLSPEELLRTAINLHKIHTSLPITKFMALALKRAQTAEDLKNIWAAATPTLQQMLTSTRPELYTLIQGLHAFDAGNKGEAANYFAQLSTPEYVQLAAPYLAEYTDFLKSYFGVYTPASALYKSRIASIAVLPDPKNNLDAVVTLINRIGTVARQDHDTLQEIHSQTYKVVVPAHVDYAQNSLKLDMENTLAESAAPVADVFATLSTISFATINNTPGLILPAHGADNSPIKFTRQSADPLAPIFPDGRYVIIKRISEENPATDGIMPPGSLLQLVSNRDVPLQPIAGKKIFDIVYEVNGTLTHPLLPTSEIPVKGYYHPSRQTTNLEIAYPLPNNQGLLQANLRCQILAHELLCGGHNVHSNRQKHAHLVWGKQTEESIAEQNNIEEQRRRANTVEPVANPRTKDVAPMNSDDISTSLSVSPSSTLVNQEE